MVSPFSNEPNRPDPFPVEADLPIRWAPQLRLTE